MKATAVALRILENAYSDTNRRLTNVRLGRTKAKRVRLNSQKRGLWSWMSSESGRYKACVSSFGACA
jgi:hypothetical protein